MQGAREGEQSDEALEDRFEAYVEEATEYAERWWSLALEPQQARLMRCPGLHGRLLTETGAIATRGVYRDELGWDELRADWHRQTLSDFRPVGAQAGDGPPLCFLTLGLPGSGKSSVLRRVASAYARYHEGATTSLVCDPDLLRMRFPEYADGLGSQIVQDELSRLCYDEPADLLGPAGPSLLKGALHTSSASGLLVLDMVGSTEHTPRVVLDARRHGWTVHVLVSDLPVAEAVRRAKLRALAAGRLVEPAYIERSSGRPLRALRACVDTGGVQGYAVIDTSGPPGSVPLLSESDQQETFGGRGARVEYW